MCVGISRWKRQKKSKGSNLIVYKKKGRKKGTFVPGGRIVGLRIIYNGRKTSADMKDCLSRTGGGELHTLMACNLFIVSHQLREFSAGQKEAKKYTAAAASEEVEQKHHYIPLWCL